MEPLKLMTPTGHLGFTPFEDASFRRGLSLRPDVLIADSGSSDIGPYPLGADVPASPERWQRYDLERLLLAARQLDIPLVIGSASDTGTNRGVHQYARLIRELARQHRLAPFTLACIYSEVKKSWVADQLQKGLRIAGLQGRPDLTMETLQRTERIVAVMGAEPIIRALEQGADVVIAGRASDTCIFAAPALHWGISPDLAYYAGKVLECASFCAEPFMGKETVIGTLDGDSLWVEPMHPDQRCTIASITSHTMYERPDPYEERLPGGVLDMRHCVYEEVNERVTRITGARFIPAAQYTIKLEGAGRVGERCLAIVGLRDPDVITRIDLVIKWCNQKVREVFGDPEEEGYRLYYHIYGRNGVMGEREPQAHIRSHEVGVVVEGVAPTQELAREITGLAARNFLYARLPGIRGTAGTAAYLSDEVLAARPGYEWTINHVVPVKDPLELFPIHLERVGG